MTNKIIYQLPNEYEDISCRKGYKLKVFSCIEGPVSMGSPCSAP